MPNPLNSIKMRPKPILTFNSEDNYCENIEPITSKFSFRPTTKRYLGKFSDKIHQEKLARGERSLGQAFMMEKVRDMCGLYERNTVLNNVTIRPIENELNKFHIITKNLSDKDRDLMRVVPKMTIGKGASMYLSNPYNSDIKQIKLFLDATDKIHRCKILDITCKCYDATLRLGTNILLIDTGKTLNCVSYNQIYDFPQRIDHLRLVPPESKLGRLDIPHECDNIKNINELFKKMISSQSVFDVRICSYEDEIYQVDIISKEEPSFAQCLYKQVPYLSPDSNSNSHKGCKDDPFIEIPTFSRQEKGPNRLLRISYQYRRAQQPKYESAPIYSGAIDYFKRRLAFQKSHRSSEPETSKEMLRVMPLYWSSPNHIAVVPLDKDYAAGHDQFIDSLKRLKCINSAEKIEYLRSKPFEPGEFVVFKNVFEDNKLGPWLRGIVVSMSPYSEHNLVKSQPLTYREKIENFKIVQQLIKDKKLDPETLIYRVRSIDYGRECRCSPVNMRHVMDLKEFKQVGTWSVRCRLFGVYPAMDKRQFSRNCIDLVDLWIRGKIIEDGLTAGFHILLRSFLGAGNHMDNFDKPMWISLFHRHTPLTDNMYFLRPKRVQFECINCILVEQGIASSSVGSIRSNILLEDHVIRTLVKHELI